MRFSFKDIEITDKALYQPYLYANPYGICEYSFANMFCWQEVYKTQAAVADGFLLVRYTSQSGGRIRYLPPVGTGDKRGIIENLAAFEKDEGRSLGLASLTPAAAAEIESLFPGMFEFTDANGMCDYIYASEDLRLLAGRKFAAKRNHINKFLKLYGDTHEYKDITPDIIPDCHKLNDRWCIAMGCREKETDYCAVKKALDYFEPLGLLGGALYVEGEIRAFALGQPNNAETFDVIAEKADKDTDGAYPFINREFASRNCADYMFINREEDLGIESLQKAKMSYHPHALLTKWHGYLREAR